MLKIPPSFFNPSTESFVGKIYYYFDDLFHTLKERIGRSYAYAKFGYMNYDFDSAYLYDLMSFKLKRIKKCIENGIAVQEEEDMKALDETIAIIDRLRVENYEEKYEPEHDAKWGKADFKFKPSFHSVRKNVNTKEEKAQEWKERLAIYDKAEQDRKNDIDRLAEILKTHALAWWE